MADRREEWEHCDPSHTYSDLFKLFCLSVHTKTEKKTQKHLCSHSLLAAQGLTCTWKIFTTDLIEAIHLPKKLHYLKNCCTTPLPDSFFYVLGYLSLSFFPPCRLHSLSLSLRFPSILLGPSWQGQECSYSDFSCRVAYYLSL